jgi:hypothetical protein
MECEYMLDLTKRIGSSVNSFKSDEKGAVTVDWVVLSASIIALSVLLVQSFVIPIDEVSNMVSDALETPDDP